VGWDVGDLLKSDIYIFIKIFFKIKLLLWFSDCQTHQHGGSTVFVSIDFVFTVKK